MTKREISRNTIKLRIKMKRCTHNNSTHKTTPTTSSMLLSSMIKKGSPSHSISITSGCKRYELSDWLGNVRVVINDRKTAVNSGSITLSYIPQIINVTDYYSFGFEISERTYSLKRYRFSFNGKEDISEQRWYQDYGARMYHRALGRFISADPLIVGQKKYAWLSSYQFASDRPIDGIDLDGLEYATFWIYIQNNKVTKIEVTKDYELKAKNTLGPGVQYNYITLDDKNPYKIKKFEMKFVKNRYGIYQGERNPQLPKVGGAPNKLYDDYSLPPIDEIDAIAKQHDIDYDKAGNLKGLSGVLDARSTDANKKYINAAEKVIKKYEKGGKDAINGRPITKEEKDAAKFGSTSFKVIERLKNPNEGKTDEQIMKDNGPKY